VSAATIWSVPVTKPKGDYELVPADNHPGRIVGLFDVGHHRKERTDQKSGTTYETDVRELVIVFELAAKTTEGQPHTMGLKYSWSMSSKSNLYELVKNVTGNVPAEGDFNPLDLLGLPALVNVVHNPGKEGKVYANIGNVTKFPGSMTQPQWLIEPLAWSVQEKTPAPELAWIPYVYGETVKMMAESSCEANGVVPLIQFPPKRNDSPPAHAFNAPTHAQSVGAEPAGKPYPPEIEALRVKHGLPDGYDLDDLRPKVDDIPPAAYRLLDAHATPF
jgi:hypothetical protein